MIYNVLTYLEESVKRVPDKLCIIEENTSCTYLQFHKKCLQAATGLTAYVKPNTPVIVYMDKGIEALVSFFSILYAGGFYALVNVDYPKERVSNIVGVLEGTVVITNNAYFEQAQKMFESVTILNIEDLENTEANEAALARIRARKIDTDPVYVNFTSGSTGVPKGIVVSHRSIIDFIEVFTDLFHITEEDILANQAPFDFDVSVKDIYSAFKTGATLVIVPKRLFTKPAALCDFLCDHKITTMIWAVSALCLMSTFHALEYRVPTTVNKILFSGEVMPYKHLKIWQTYLPDVMYVNLYGPTEITCNCTYHILEKDRDYSEGLPIGIPFPNEDVFLLDDKNTIITDKDIEGEICVRGTALALGYYNLEGQNNAFIHNPLHNHYPERIYKTHDLGKYNDRGELMFCGRKDFQIKYQGHRIELEEIEKAMLEVSGVLQCRCVFDQKREKLKAFYVGDIDRKDLHKKLKEKLPTFMIPGRITQLEELPMTKNGKIDRQALLSMNRR